MAGSRGGVALARQLIPILDQLRAQGASPATIAQVRALDPAMGDALQLFNDLIAQNQNNPTILADLTRTRNDFINSTLGDFENSLKDSITEFEAAQVKLADLGTAPIDEVFYGANTRVDVSKLFRSGVQIAPFFDGNIDGTNFRGKPKEERFGGKGLEDLYAFHAGLDANFPSDADAARWPTRPSACRGHRTGRQPARPRSPSVPGCRAILLPIGTCAPLRNRRRGPAGVGSAATTLVDLT